MKRQIFNSLRVAFVKDGCPYCKILKSVIPKVNVNLPINKQIKIVDCTVYSHYGIKTNPLIGIYEKYIKGFPTLFIEGSIIQGANTEVELETFLKVFLKDDFFEYPNLSVEKYGAVIPLTFDKKCKFKKGFLGERVVCE